MVKLIISQEKLKSNRNNTKLPISLFQKLKTFDRKNQADTGNRHANKIPKNKKCHTINQKTLSRTRNKKKIS